MSHHGDTFVPPPIEPNILQQIGDLERQLAEAQGKLEAVRKLNSHLIPSHSPALDRILGGNDKHL